MKGLINIPSQKELAKAYIKLNEASRVEGVSIQTIPTTAQIALWSQWCRLDPRLAELFVRALSICWVHLPPSQLNKELAVMPWPTAFGVLGEQSKDYLLKAPSEKMAFNYWIQCVMVGLSKTSYELFFIGQRKIAGKEMYLDASLTIESYYKWGFLSREILVNKYSNNGHTLISRSRRQSALRFLLKKKKRITTQDYINWLEGLVSRRQAQMDLQNSRLLKPDGRTRGRTYITARQRSK